jgi:predicted kinase
MSNLILLVGIPASGKSTRSQIHEAAGLTVLSSDVLRAVFGTSQEDQSVSRSVFLHMENETARLLAENHSVVIDATNYNKKNRSRFVPIGRKAGAHIIAEVFNTPLDVCKARNAARGRAVPDFVIERMFNGFEMPLVGEVDEVRLF